MAPAWYYGTKDEFLGSSSDMIANQLAGRAASESLEVGAEQHAEWQRSAQALHRALDERVPIIHEALASLDHGLIHSVILEYDFRRRGLRLDCVLLGDGIVFVIEFKRSKIQRSDRDQVMSYAVNLVEFHEITHQLATDQGLIVVPIIALTGSTTNKPVTWPGLGGRSWPSIANRPLECDGKGLGDALQLGLNKRISSVAVPLRGWMESPFSPSSSILDATLSLYGNHDVSAIQEHAAPKAEIDACTAEIRQKIDEALIGHDYHVVFLSGAPGAGKTLVGLDVIMRGPHARESVFVTGNAPLVEVLNKALSKSYNSKAKNADSWALTGYHRLDAPFVASAAAYKIVKAHQFLGKRGQDHNQKDGRVLVFDEAQRTYEKGRPVMGHKLQDHEADLILDVQKEAYPSGGAVVVALIGHNQAINRGEMGIGAWLEAVDRKGWSFSIADETLNLSEVSDREKWKKHPRRRTLQHGHLHCSMRYYRNTHVESWVSAVLDNKMNAAAELAAAMDAHDNTIWITRSLDAARCWAREQTVGSQRCGLIASGQAKRLAAVGLFVDYKPDIATWMLAPSADVRSSNALETVQNQYQIQGLELDYSIACWDADLRREDDAWRAYKLSGTDWRRDGLLDVAKNGHRVILTRARKGMVIFVPEGDASGKDSTRQASFYDGTWEFLLSCGAKNLSC